MNKHKAVAGGGFPVAQYNELKVAKGVAELMAMENVSELLRNKVETLHRFGLEAATEIERYLRDCSQTYGNTRTTRFQFHVSASVKGRSITPDELTDFARKLMEGMGYGKQPYFVYAHHDTGNNHVHILSTRIRPNGLPISDHQDYRRLNEVTNRILSSDMGKDIERIFSYDYQTEGQFLNILKAHGFKAEKERDGYRILKNGGKAGVISMHDILERISKDDQRRKERAAQLRAILRKYKGERAEGKCQNAENAKVQEQGKKKAVKAKMNPDIRKIHGSDGKPLTKEDQENLRLFIDPLKTRFGLDIHFQKDRNGQVRGYSLIDHAERIGFDGSQIMKLSELIDFAPKQQRQPSPLDVYRNLFTVEIGREGLKDYVSIRMKDGSSHKTSISAKQVAWYNGVRQEEKENVALQIAATMFQEQILVAYLKQAPDFNPEFGIKSITGFKHRNGGFAYRITMTDGFVIPAIPMIADESHSYHILSPESQADFLKGLAIHHLTVQTAQEFVKRIRTDTQTQLRLNTLPPRRSEYTPEIITKISFNLAQLLSRFNIPVGEGQNREWEVGRNNPYDDLDTRQLGTIPTM